MARRRADGGRIIYGDSVEDDFRRRRREDGWCDLDLLRKFFRLECIKLGKSLKGNGNSSSRFRTEMLD